MRRTEAPPRPSHGRGRSHRAAGLRARASGRGPAAERTPRPAAAVHRQKPARADRRHADRRDRRREGPRSGLTIPEIVPGAAERPTPGRSTRCIPPRTTPSWARRRSGCTRRWASPCSSLRSPRRRLADGRRRWHQGAAGLPRLRARPSAPDRSSTRSAASPLAIEIRDTAALHAFAAYLQQTRLTTTPPRTPESRHQRPRRSSAASSQVLHNHIEHERGRGHRRVGCPSSCTSRWPRSSAARRPKADRAPAAGAGMTRGRRCSGCRPATMTGTERG